MSPAALKRLRSHAMWKIAALLVLGAGVLWLVVQALVFWVTRD